MQTTAIHMLKLKTISIDWSREIEALVSTRINIKDIMCFKQDGVISLLNGKPLKLID